MIKTSVMKELRRSSHIILRKSILTCRIGELAFLFFVFFSIRVFCHKYHDSQDSRGRGGAIFLTPLYHFHRHLDISQVIAAKSSPLHIAGSRSQTRNLWLSMRCHLALSYTPFKIHPFYTFTDSLCC